MAKEQRLDAKLTTQLRSEYSWLENMGHGVYTHPISGYGFSGLHIQRWFDETYFIQPFLHLPGPSRPGWTLNYGDRIKHGHLESWNLANDDQYRQLLSTLRSETIPRIAIRARDEEALQQVRLSAKRYGVVAWNDATVLNIALGREGDARDCLRRGRAELDIDPCKQFKSWILQDGTQRQLVDAMNVSFGRAREVIYEMRAEGLKKLGISAE